MKIERKASKVKEYQEKCKIFPEGKKSDHEAKQ
jgi:hypothetical protein